MHRIYVPDTISMGDLQTFARSQDCELAQTPEGDYYFAPHDKVQPHQGNANVVKIPLRKNQLHGEPGNTNPPDILA